MKNFWFHFRDFLYPQKCFGCQQRGHYLCPDCFNRLIFRAQQVCPGCKKYATPHGEMCLGCAPRWALQGLLVLAPYRLNLPLQRLIKSFKYAYHRETIDTVGNLLRWLVRQHFPTAKPLFVPVPLFEKRQAWRSYNQAEELCRRLGEWRKLLTRVINTKSQARFHHRAQRLRNLKQAFTYCPEPQPDYARFVILVDDVATTLSTLEECAKILKEAGYERIWGIVICRG